jgi:hypothetical protein
VYKNCRYHKGSKYHVFEEMFTFDTQIKFYFRLNYPHFIHRMCINKLGVIYVDIYVYNVKKIFFFQKYRIFAEFSLTL